MPKEEWGVKRVCPTTGKRFYDLNRNPVISPYTGEEVPIDDGSKSRVMVADKEDASAKPAEEAVVEDAEVVLEEVVADVDLGDDVLEDDDDDVDVPLEEITPESHAITDLEIDSLDFFDVVFSIDKTFGIQIPLEAWMEEVNQGETPAEEYFVMKNLCAHIDRLVAEKAA